MSSDKNECILIYSFEHHFIVTPTDMFQFTKEHDIKTCSQIHVLHIFFENAFFFVTLIFYE